jgi:hypothetical protein
VYIVWDLLLLIYSMHKDYELQNRNVDNCLRVGTA